MFGRAPAWTLFQVEGRKNQRERSDLTLLFFSIHFHPPKESPKSGCKSGLWINGVFDKEDRRTITGFKHIHELPERSLGPTTQKPLIYCHDLAEEGMRL
jgi:hypothetical protein